MDTFSTSLIAGSAAGACVDVILYPLDTVKTRLQSAQGFRSSGGFSNIYRGIGPVIVGSAPNSAAFFCTYDCTKELLEQTFKVESNSFVHMFAAMLGEVNACIVRVPIEILKQRRQACAVEYGRIFRQILSNEGLSGFYRGYFSTIFREIPFSVIQVPLWEYIKLKIRQTKGSITPLDSCISGGIAGGVSASLTTPIDVAKTRIMLANSDSSLARGNISLALKTIYYENGFKGLFAGVVPRTMAISLGGAIFFGAYDLVKHVVTGSHSKQKI